MVHLRQLVAHLMKSELLCTSCSQLHLFPVCITFYFTDTSETQMANEIPWHLNDLSYTKNHISFQLLNTIVLGNKLENCICKVLWYKYKPFSVIRNFVVVIVNCMSFGQHNHIKHTQNTSSLNVSICSPPARFLSIEKAVFSHYFISTIINIRQESHQ